MTQKCSINPYNCFNHKKVSDQYSQSGIFLHKISLTQRAYFRFISKAKLINIFVGNCTLTVVNKLIWGRKCDLMLMPYTGFQRATLDYVLWNFRQNHLSSLTTASSFVWNREEWGLPPAHGEQSMTRHALGWKRHDLFTELMVHTTVMFKGFLK